MQTKWNEFVFMENQQNHFEYHEIQNLHFLGAWNAFSCFVERSLIENSNEEKKTATHQDGN